jgi:hypothetical protein
LVDIRNAFRVAAERDLHTTVKTPGNLY